MPNVSKPMGLSPVGYLNGASWNGKGRTYAIASTDVNAFAIGDPLKLAGGVTADGVPLVTLAVAGAGNDVVGALLGAGGLENGSAFVDPANLDTTIIPATKSKVYYVMVADDPNTIFEIQEDSVGGAITAANGTKNFNLVSGANNGYLSGWQLDSSTGAVGATLQLKAIGIAPRQDNAVGTNAKWRVIINQHTYRAGTVGL